MIPSVRRYVETRAVTFPWRIEGCGGERFSGAVVIPALAEEKDLFETLSSLAGNPPGLLKRFLTVVVVNNRADADPADRDSNRRTLLRLAQGDAVPSGMPPAWVDASSPGKELPPGEGVGLARRIGCDLALERLDWSASPPLLVFLDADTLVDADYLPALMRHFEQARAGGAVLPFIHQPAQTARQQQAALHYELYLRSYVLGLAVASSPYAFHTIGSTIACRADAYVRAGGMNRRTAGEDFYFLQQLAKTTGVAPLSGTIVRPSARISRRTPFGTGPTIARQLEGEKPITFYHPECFRILGEWLGAAAAADPLEQARRISPELASFLEAEGFQGTWERLRLNYRGENLRKAFHVWFDGLRTLRLIHALSAGSYPRDLPQRALPPLLKRAGISLYSPEPEAMLQLMRQMQGTSDRIETDERLCPDSRQKDVCL